MTNFNSGTTAKQINNYTDKTMEKTRCKSPYCVEVDGLHGRYFTPQGKPGDLTYTWCPICIHTSRTVQFCAAQTAQMIRNKYAEYRPDALPPRVRVILQQFTNELLQELGESEL